MSGHGYTSDCPCCGSEGSMECQSDTRPIDSASGVCVVCGFQYWTQMGFADKETLEQERADQEYTPKPMTDEMKKRIADYTKNYNLGNKGMTIQEGRNLLIGWMIGMLMITVIFAISGVI